MLNGPSNTWVCAAEPGQAVSDALGAVTFLCHIFWSKKVTCKIINFAAKEFSAALILQGDADGSDK